MKRIVLVASVAACFGLFALRGSSLAQSTTPNVRMFGIYPAIVVNAQDPSQRGRLKLRIPAVSLTTESWARPSAPYVDGTIGSIKLPPVDSEVWVQFVAGEPTLPVWVGWTPH
jgi:uncharacterized protein involved in type VI secretion and phage assembly